MPLSMDPEARPLRVHLVEDDDDLREDMVLLLTTAGFEVHGQAEAQAFYKAHALAPCDVAVLDIGLRGEDGLSVAANLRATGAIGIVMASARGAVEDRIEALRLGADVYMVKPIHIEELVATVRSLGSRVRAMSAAAAPEAGAASWHLSEGNWMLCDPEGRRLKLSPNERTFLACLQAVGEGVARREDMLRRIDGERGVADPKRLDVIASRLRRKAEQAGMRLPLHAVRGSGFQFVWGVRH